MVRLWFSVVLVYVAASVLQQGDARGSGAPSSACQSLTPQHVNITESTTDNPYTIMPASTTYQPGGTLRVQIMGGAFRGIFLQARNTNNMAVGFWSDFPDFTRSMQCNNSADSVTHQNTTEKPAGTNFTWNAPRDSPGTIVFVATIAQARETFWANITSTDISGGNRAGFNLGAAVFSLLTFVMTNQILQG